MANDQGIKRGIYKGLTASALREGTYSTMRFTMYEPIKKVYGGSNPSNIPWYTKFLAGATTGLISSGFANPADIIKTRMQAMGPGKHYSLSKHANIIYSSHGVNGFFIGVRATVSRSVVVNAVHLGSYDTIKHFILDKNWMEEGFKCQFVTSVITGFLVTFFTSPLDNIKTKMMTRTLNQPKYTTVKPYKGMIDCA